MRLYIRPGGLDLPAVPVDLTPTDEDEYHAWYPEGEDRQGDLMRDIRR
jgi:hypothetical protein